MEVEEGVPVFVEAELLPQCRMLKEELIEKVETFLKGGMAVFSDGPVDFSSNEVLAKSLAALNIVDLAISNKVGSATSSHTLSARKLCLHGNQDGPAESTQRLLTSWH